VGDLHGIAANLVLDRLFSCSLELARICIFSSRTSPALSLRRDLVRMTQT